MDYDFELDKLNAEIKKRSAKRVLIQLPEGLKSKFVEITSKLDAESVLAGDACFGACDIKTLPECDLTIHFGHAKFISTPEDSKILYVTTNALVACLPAVEKHMPLLKDKKTIGLLTTSQHSQQTGAVKQFLEKHGFTVFLEKGGSLVDFPGQVLGCDQTAAMKINDKVDAFLFVGSGEFHPLGVAFSNSKLIIVANPYSRQAKLLADAARLEKEKHLRLEKARDARVFGVIVGEKPGQHWWKTAETIKKSLEEQGKKAFLISMNEVTPDKLDYLPFDAFVITACPRIVIDDWKNYKKPVLLGTEIAKLKQYYGLQTTGEKA